MFKKKITILFFVVFSTFVLGQEKISKEKTDSIAFYFNNAKGDNTLKYLKKAVVLAAKTNNDSIIKKVNIEYGLQSLYRKDTLGLHVGKLNLLNVFKNSKDSFALAKAYHLDAMKMKVLYRTDSAFYYYQQSKNISLLTKDSLAVARRLLNMALIQKKEKDYLGSEITTIEALKYIEPLQENIYTVSLYNNLGNVLVDQGRYEEGRNYLKKAFETNKKNPNTTRRIKDNLFYFNNVGVSYNYEGKYNKAIFYFKKGMQKDSLLEKYKRHYYLFIDNISYSYFKLGDNKKALKGYLKGLKYREEINDLYFLPAAHINLVEFYIKEGNINKAQHYAKEALKTSIKSKNSKKHLASLKYLSQLTKNEQSKIYLKKYIQLNDSLYEREKAIKNQFTTIRYEVDKKEKENTFLKIENNNKQAQLKSEKLKKTIGIISTFGALALFLLSVLYFKNRRKRLLFKTQLEKAEAREKERQQIAKSLHDEVAGDLRLLHQKLEKNKQFIVAKSLNSVKENVRNLSHKLSSVSFEEVSFKDQIINLISDYISTSFKISVDGIDNCNWSEINNSIKRTLYLSIRESIQNTLKYAEANKMKINFESLKNNIHLTIQDNGKGFNTKSIKNGIGLKNLKERVIELNGTISVNSNLEKGTEIQITLPINV